MKHLSAFLLCLLTSCYPYGKYSYDPIQSAEPTPPQYSSGIYKGVHWGCSQEEVNNKLVWVKCDFENVSTKLVNICINVGYRASDEYSGYVVNHRVLCTGLLMPNSRTENYAAFVDYKDKLDERSALRNLCGHNLKYCYMITFADKQI